MATSLHFSGLPGGEENGQRGYMLTFVIAYIRVSFCLVVGVTGRWFESAHAGGL